MKRIFVLLALVLILSLPTSVMARRIVPTGVSQGDLVEFLTQLQTKINHSNNAALTYGNFHKHGTSSHTTDIGTTFGFTIAGISYSKTASDTIASVSASAQAAGTNRVYLVSVDATGSVTTTAGTAVATGITPEYPALPASNAPFGSIRIDILSSASEAFDLGTDAFDLLGASMTATFYNLSTVPIANIDITDF